MKFYESKYFIPVFLIALTTLAALFRLNHLGWNQLFIDESWVGYLTTLPWWMMQGADVHPILSAALIRIPVTLFGMSEFNLRILPAIFSIIGVPLTYYFAKEVTGKEFPSLIAAILMAVSIFEIEQAAMARMYDFLLIFLLLFMIFFLRAYHTNKPKYWYLAGAMGILQIITWYYSIIPIGITVLWYFLRDGKKIFQNKPFLYSCIAFISTCILLVPSFLVAVTLKSSENNNLIYKGMEVIYQAMITFFGSPPVLAGFISLIAIIGWFLLFKDNETDAGYLGLLCFMSLVIGALASYELMILSRYLYYLAPIGYTFIGFFIYRVYQSQKIEWKGAITALFIFLIVLGSFCLVLPGYYAVQHNYSGNWSSHAADFSKIKGNATEVALIGNPAYVFMFAYYDQDPQLHFNRFDNLTEVKKMIQGKESLVLIPDYAIPTDQPEAKVIYDWLQINGKMEETYRGFQVYRVNYNV